jgi:hypothetical protein
VADQAALSPHDADAEEAALGAALVSTTALETLLAPSLDTKWGPAEHHGVALGGQHIPARDLYFAEYADRQGALVTAAYHAARTARFEWGER